MGCIVITLSLTEFITSHKLINSSSIKSPRQLVETSRPPPSMQIIGLEHKNSSACPHCTAAESHKSFCLLDPLRQLSCEPVCVVHPCLWTL